MNWKGLSSSIAAAMEEQGATTQEVSRNISEAGDRHPVGFGEHRDGV